MDAQALLLRHGWSGPGNPLNPSRRRGPHDGLGLSKPLLVARRQGNHGVGKKTTKDPTNQWWLRGFEDALKGVGGAAPPLGSTGSSVRPNALTSELYRFFVRGEVVPGTIGGVGGVDEKKADAGDGGAKKRKLGDGNQDGEEEGVRKKVKGESKEERRARKQEKRIRKEEKRIRKEEKKRRREEKEVRRAERKAKKEKKARARSSPAEAYPTPPSTEEQTESSGRDEAVEKELSKQRKREKKEKKERKEKESKSKSESKKPKDGKKSTSG